MGILSTGMVNMMGPRLREMALEWVSFHTCDFTQPGAHLIRRRQLVLEKQGKFAFSKPQLFDDVISTSSHIGDGV